MIVNGWNSRFLKNRFTFCGVNTNFGQQWAPPAYYHLTPIVSKGKHWYLQNGYRTDFSLRTLLAWYCCSVIFSLLASMMTSSSENIICVTGPLWRKFTGHRWIPFIQASDGELWCFLRSAPEQTFEQTIGTRMIWNAIALITTSI